jgi:hypothetical protein
MNAVSIASLDKDTGSPDSIVEERSAAFPSNGSIVPSALLTPASALVLITVFPEVSGFLRPAKMPLIFSFIAATFATISAFLLAFSSGVFPLLISIRPAISVASSLFHDLIDLNTPSIKSEFLPVPEEIPYFVRRALTSSLFFTIAEPACLIIEFSIFIYLMF